MRSGDAVADVVAEHPSLGVFTGAYAAVFLLVAWSRHDPRVWAYMVVLTVLVVAVAGTHRVARLSPGLLWALSLVGLLHLCGGLLPSPTPGAAVFYETWLVTHVLKFDQFVHFTGTAVLTVGCWQVVTRWVDPSRAPAVGLVMVAGLMGLGLGALNEVFEFVAAEHVRGLQVGGLANRGWDLIFNLGGAATVVGVLLAGRVPHRHGLGSLHQVVP
jgi:hypothetical protein